VYSLVPPGADPHTYQPSARDVTRVADADIILTVGLGLEQEWLDKLMQNASTDPAKVFSLGDAVDPITFEDGHGHASHSNATATREGEESPRDPHFWQDPLRAKTAVQAIATRLAAADRANASSYQANAAAYAQRLDELDAWIKAQVEHIPQDRRVLVTSHEALGYFAHRYGFTIVGVIIPGGATGSEPSAAEMAALVDKVKEHRAPAVFTENVVSDKLAQRLAEDSGVTVVRSLYSDSLSPAGKGGDTYLAIMRANVTVIVEALR
jgi:ABC-type Zn uptake system ZnuABC Zn-binding protein ZnuA